VYVPHLTATGLTFDTVPVPNVGLLIKHKHINKEREKKTLTQNIFSKNENLQKGINGFRAAAQNRTRNFVSVANRVAVPLVATPHNPSQETVLSFFATKNYPTTEAHKFFNHYQSNGWLVGGKAPMQDWQCSANKWMLNEPNFKPAQRDAKPCIIRPLHTNFQTTKDYAQPL